MSTLRDRLVERARAQTRADHLPSNREMLIVHYRIGTDDLVVRQDRIGLTFPPVDSVSADLLVMCERPIFDVLVAGEASFMDYFSSGRLRIEGDPQAVLYVAERNLLFELLREENTLSMDTITELLT